MNQLLWEGLNLMLIGMGAVFLFLVLLVFATGVMSRLVNHFFPEPEPFTIQNKQLSSTSSSQGEDGALMAVIAAAVHRYRSRHK